MIELKWSPDPNPTEASHKCYQGCLQTNERMGEASWLHVCVCVRMCFWLHRPFLPNPLPVLEYRMLLSFCTVLRRDKYEKHIELYWVETKTGGRKLSLICIYTNHFFKKIKFKNHLRSLHIKEKKTSSLGRRMQHE